MHRWIDDEHISVDDTVFHLWGTPAAATEDNAEVNVFKRRSQVERYLRCAEEFRGARVMEVGVFRGGSTAFLAAILEPEKLVAFDISTERNVWLDRWLRAHGQADRVRLHHGVDQADRRAVVRLVHDEFEDRPLDLVIDDASHLLTPTTATFNVLFPRLRPGGVYVIEDWSWQLVWNEVLRTRPRVHQAIEETTAAVSEREAGHPTPDEGGGQSVEPQMWRLALRLAIACGTHEDLISDVEMIRGFAAVRRGPLELDPESFDLDEWVVDSPV